MYTKKIKLRKTRRGGMNPRRTASTRSATAPRERPAPVIPAPARPGSISTTQVNARPPVKVITPSMRGTPGGRGKGKGRGFQMSRTPSKILNRGTGSDTSVQSINAVSPVTTINAVLPAAPINAVSPVTPSVQPINALSPAAPINTVSPVTTINAVSPAAPINTVSPVTPSVQPINAVSPAAPSLQPAILNGLPPPAAPKSTSIELEQIKTASKAALEEMKAAVDKLTKALVPSQNQTQVAEIASGNGAPDALSADGKGTKAPESAASANRTGAAEALSADGKGPTSEKAASANGTGPAGATSLPTTQPQNILGNGPSAALGGGAPVPTDLYYPKNSYLTPT